MQNAPVDSNKFGLPEFGVAICHNGEGRITDWNHSAEVLYGFTKAEALGHTNVELLRSESAVPWPVIFQELQAGREWHGEFWNHRRTGTPVAVAAHLLPNLTGGDMWKSMWTLLR